MTNAEIEQMARALCRADGEEPDIMVYPFRNTEQQRTKQGYPVFRPEDLVPAWMTYRRLAIAAIEARDE